VKKLDERNLRKRTVSAPEIDDRGVQTHGWSEIHEVNFEL